MASSASRREDMQIVICHVLEFVHCIPSCFEIGSGNKLHHKRDQVNVISHKDDFFVDAYPTVLKVENLNSFLLLKQRLLSLPIYMSIPLSRGNLTPVATVIMVNTKHWYIQAQLRLKLHEAEEMYRRGKNFALEFSFKNVLNEWLKSQRDPAFKDCYSRDGNNFCITNFHQKCGWCTNVFCWIYCFPMCLLVAPLHCAYRAVCSSDSKFEVQATVTREQMLTSQQLATVMQMFFAAAERNSPQTANEGHLNERLHDAPPEYSAIAPLMNDQVAILDHEANSSSNVSQRENDENQRSTESE